MRCLYILLSAVSLVCAQNVQWPDLDKSPQTVSVFELEHPVQKKALHEGALADDAYRKGDMKKYIEHVRKAVDLDPEYITARRNLGIAYIMTGDLDDAINELHETLVRDPHSATSYEALSCAYLQADELAKAETAARQALNLDSLSDRGRYYLGISLTEQHKNNEEALGVLHKIARRYPKAHIAAAQTLNRLGMRTAAKGELGEYLSSGEQDARKLVRNWLSSMR